MKRNEKVLVTGGTGLAGSAIVRALLRAGFSNIIATYNRRTPKDCFSKEVTESRAITFVHIDLLCQNQVAILFASHNPAYVFLAAAKVGGIMANHTHRAEFIYHNLQIQNNIIHYSYLNNVKKLLFLGSTCIYPQMAPQPIAERSLMTGLLEYTSEPYGIAKIAGVKMCESYNMQYGTNFVSVMPTNLYGPNDNYDLKNSHFLAAFFRKMFLGRALMESDFSAIRRDLRKNPIDSHIDDSNQGITRLLSTLGITKDADSPNVTITLWGTGSPRREIMHSDDLADACLHVMDHIDFNNLIEWERKEYSEGVIREEIRNCQINIGLGYDFTIKEVAMRVKKIVGFEGNILWDRTLPDGTPQKLTNTEKLAAFGWKSRISLEEGLKEVFESYSNAYSEASMVEL